MFIGEYSHTIDDKNRISLPVKFRKLLGKQIVVTHGLDNCLFVYSMSEWKKISQKLGELGMLGADRRAFNRFMLAGASEITVDAIGRILLPEHLRKFAQLNANAVFAGVYNRLEIWDEKKWNEYKDEMSKQADSMAEKLGEIGAI